MKITVEAAQNALRSHEGKTFLELFRHGSMSVEIYAPIGHDPQQPHEQDEIYVVISGDGIFQNGDQRYPFQPGDLLFVPAGVEHRFLEFSEDFKTWVIFFMPPAETPAPDTDTMQGIRPRISRNRLHTAPEWTRLSPSDSLFVRIDPTQRPHNCAKTCNSTFPRWRQK